MEQRRKTRHPVKPAEASDSARGKKKTHETASGWVVHDWKSLLAHLGTRSRVTFQVGAEGSGATFQQLSQPDEIQAEAMRLLGSIAIETAP